MQDSGRPLNGRDCSFPRIFADLGYDGVEVLLLGMTAEKAEALGRSAYFGLPGTAVLGGRKMRDHLDLRDFS